MKKCIAVILLFCLVLSCTGCSMISFIMGENAEMDKYLALTAQELSAMSDDDLLYALYRRTEHAANTTWDLGEGAAKLPQAQKAFYVIYCFQQETANGGLCRFFVNGTRNLAPLVSECLGTVGAQAHKELFDGFVEKNKIDVTYLIYFIIDDESQFAEQRKRYPFDDFDVPYSELPSLRELLIQYAREHIEEF